MPPVNEQKDFASSSTNHRPFLITLSARAIGSLGFGLSILAIWLRWIVPSSKSAAPAVGAVVTHTPHRPRRQMTLPVPAAQPTRRVTLPIMINTNDSNQDGSNRSKHVYFVDTPASLRNSSPTEHPLEAVNQNVSPIITPPEESPSTSFSSPSLAAPHANDMPLRRDTYDESIAESDSSSRRSSLSSRLPRIMHPFVGKARHGLGSSEPTSASAARTPPPLQLFDGTKAVRRSSIGFTAPWSARNRKGTDTQADSVSSKSSLPFRRPSTSKAAISPRSPSTDSIQSPPTSYFSLKSHRRTSTPTSRTRTQPYEAPYFATPPTSGDLTAFDSRKSPQILHEALMNSTRRRESARQEISNEEGYRGRPENTRAQVALGNGRPRMLAKRRSASESWINGRSAHL
ncbi:hypothetical protein FPV67DRAFT_1444197 [Lyophyllum atratum]|nr:hypothetical protein FPV67DRAFT_1444197 [Lyophyllum atratum]